MTIELYTHQKEALKNMKDKCILCGGVGSGKSLTSLMYYFNSYGGRINKSEYKAMKNPVDLYIITTAKKRDDKDWEKEMSPFLLSTDKKSNHYNIKVVVDSWNNIKKYINIKNAFFIFDEQKLVSYGAWTKTFLKIVKSNRWILLSATPGDTWMDYCPIFIANGFYKNKTEFQREHVVYSRFTNFPKVSKYISTKKLERLRNSILIEMPDQRHTIRHNIVVNVNYNQSEYKHIMKTRWDPFKDEPIQNAGVLCYILRKIVNSDTSRDNAVLDIFRKHKRIIIFYNYDYELERLKGLYYGQNAVISEWNGHCHSPVPTTEKWVYLVQYTAGAEGWNCISTNAVIFYSQNYSYKILEQASGRIDRMNTKYTDLYYYHLRSKAPIDIAIYRALKTKKKFNERNFVGGYG